jgi:hypothetical protein
MFPASRKDNCTRNIVSSAVDRGLSQVERCRQAIWISPRLQLPASYFFPSSGAVNPALTIMPNALRVADQPSGMFA